MRNRTALSLSAALVLVLSVSTVAVGGERVRRWRDGAVAPYQIPRFGVSGEFTGALSGTIVLDQTLYQLDPNVQVYEIGTGLVPVGTMLSDRWIHVYGVKRGETLMIQGIIIRPASEPTTDQGDSETHVHEVHDVHPS